MIMSWLMFRADNNEENDLISQLRGGENNHLFRT